jgi:hypothetical protein
MGMKFLPKKFKKDNYMVYFRHKKDGTYYSAKPVSTDRSESFDIKVFWVFRNIKTDEEFSIHSPKLICDNFEPCSGFEAISSTF